MVHWAWFFVPHLTLVYVLLRDDELPPSERRFPRAARQMAATYDLGCVGYLWAAMPSLHFGSSLMAAALLRETGAVAGALGWAYALTLGFALVYLGEHYVTDLAAGAVLAAAVRGGEPVADPVVSRLSGAIQRLERIANS
jgi:membrane-associated phospholipid phosphatase